MYEAPVQVRLVVVLCTCVLFAARVEPQRAVAVKLRAIREFGPQKTPFTAPFRSVVTTARGGLIVVQPQTQRIVAFDGTGEFQWSDSGSAGVIGTAGDTIYVFDRKNDRVLFLSKSGRHLGEGTFPVYSLADPLFRAEPFGVLGQLVLAAPARTIPMLEARLEVPILLGTFDGDLLAEVGTVRPGPEPMTFRSTTPRAQAMQGFGGALERYSQELIVAPSPTGASLLLVSREASNASVADVHLIRVSATGDTVLRRTIRVHAERLDPRLVDSLAEAFTPLVLRWYTSRDSARADIRRKSVLGLKSFLPPLRDALTGADGSIWLLLNGRDGPTATWRVLKKDGGFLFDVDLPARVRLLTATTTTAWGTERLKGDTVVLDMYSIHHRRSPTRP